MLVAALPRDPAEYRRTESVTIGPKPRTRKMIGMISGSTWRCSQSPCSLRCSGAAHRASQEGPAASASPRWADASSPPHRALQ